MFQILGELTNLEIAFLSTIRRIGNGGDFTLSDRLEIVNFSTTLTYSV